jgi:dihydrolipoamide dehydrogenase
VKQTDVIVIGAGPAGYVCAIRLSQLGRKVVLVERDRVGGVCLNRGCIPVKSLLHAAQTVRNAAEARTLGITFGRPEVDVIALYAWQSRVVERLVKGVEYLLKADGVELLRGVARVTGPKSAVVTTGEGEAALEAGVLVIATGSEPVPLPCLPVDGRSVIDSNGALDIVALPHRLAVVGAGVVGLEFATFFSRLGAKVTVLEMLEQILPGTDRDVASALQRLMQREGVEFRLGVKVTGYEAGRLAYADASGSQSVEADKVLVAVGRRPLGAGLEAAAARLDDKGFVRTDASYRANAEGVYAVGDVRGGPLLAHKAMAEGLAVAELITGNRPHRFRAVPSCVYTDPEVATVGLSEAEARAEGRDVKVSRVPASAVGRSLTLGRSEGLCKLVVDAGTDKVLGAALLCPQADALIAEACVAVELGLKAADIGRVVHPHPTMSELLFEAAEAIHGRAIHVVNR